METAFFILYPYLILRCTLDYNIDIVFLVVSQPNINPCYENPPS